MELGDYAYYFQPIGHGVLEGARDPRSEHFRDQDLENAVVREVVQNALDARPGPEPVRVTISLDEVVTEEIPGIGSLRAAARSAAEIVGTRTEGADEITTAHEFLQEPSISLLTISDSGTTGLLGDENDRNSGLAALTRSSGLSAARGGRGGSFGIGAAVGVLASQIRTVGYLTRQQTSQETIYASWTQLASHLGEDGEERHGRGTFMLASDSHGRSADKVRYPRFDSPLGGPLVPRTETGTSVLIYAYKNADSDPELHRLRLAAAENFLVAIREGDLAFEGKREGKALWRLDAENISSFLEGDDDPRVKDLHDFWRALDQEPISRELPELGSVSLHILPLDEKQADRRSLYTMAMRRPKMKIEIIQTRGLLRPYAAVFICDDEVGNEKLRSLEGPAHDGWKNRVGKADSRIYNEVRGFIKETLREHLGHSSTGSLEVRDLNKLLPQPTDVSESAFTLDDPASRPEETWSTVTGDIERRATAASDQGDQQVRRSDGGNLRPSPRRSPQRTSAKNPPSNGTGASRNGGAAEGLEIRAFAPSLPEDAPSESVLTLRASDREVTTDLSITVLDGFGARLAAKILRAVDLETGEPFGVSLGGDRITDIRVPADGNRRIRLLLEGGGKKKLEVTTYGA